MDDAALVRAAQGGDRNALDQLLRRHYDRIHAVCVRIAGGTRDADDACQEALIKIVRSIDRFDGRSAFSTWAYRIATNAALDELRRRSRRATPLSGGERDEPVREVVDPRSDRAFDDIDDRTALDPALAQLPDDFRVAVVLRDVADLDYAEIAEALDVPVGTVKSRIARGRMALARTLRLDDLPSLDDLAEPAADQRDDAITERSPRQNGNRTATGERRTSDHPSVDEPVDPDAGDRPRSR
jgi:RNA polymerase sigma-70 factor (ECF subfamily)